MRKLATIRVIDDIKPIDGADAIELAIIGGWQAVVKKNEFAVGTKVVYLEVDSWVPQELAPFLVKGKEAREYNGVKGERLKTIKLRGALSQGLVLSIETCIDVFGCTSSLEEGVDVTEWLNIQKWERAVPTNMAGVVKGNFPSQIPKTDQERVQNLSKEVNVAVESALEFEVTEKLEGSSMTVYIIDGEFGVCSRNIDLKRDENNVFWKCAIEASLEQKMRVNRLDNFAIQGELIGNGIQGNIYGLGGTEFHVYAVYDIQAGEYLLPKERRALAAYMELQHVPVINTAIRLVGVPEIIGFADGISKLANVKREGVVFAETRGGMTFKAISNAYLLGEKS